MTRVALVLLLAWYFAVGRDVHGPYDTRARCEKAAGIAASCYCVLMFPTDCNDLTV